MKLQARLMDENMIRLQDWRYIEAGSLQDALQGLPRPQKGQILGAWSGFELGTYASIPNVNPWDKVMKSGGWKKEIVRFE